MLDELCNKTTNVIAVQEHWLRSDVLDKFNIINTDFNYHAVSAMDNAVSCGILKGRPFGGVGFLWHKCFDRNIQVLSNDPAGRCLVIKLNINLRSICYLICIFLVSSQALNIVLRLPIIWVL